MMAEMEGVSERLIGPNIRNSVHRASDFYGTPSLRNPALSVKPVCHAGKRGPPHVVCRLDAARGDQRVESVAALENPLHNNRRLRPRPHPQPQGLDRSANCACLWLNV